MRIVDVHAHYYPKEYLALLERVIRNDSTVWGRAVQELYATRLTKNPRMTDINAHIDDMDAAGVEMHALSLSIPHVYFEDPNDATEAARIVNDSIAELVAKYPARFKGLAILPLPHTDAALKELDRAITTLGLHGAALGGNVRGAGLDDERFLPLYREMNRMNLMVHLHRSSRPVRRSWRTTGWQRRSATCWTPRLACCGWRRAASWTRTRTSSSSPPTSGRCWSPHGTPSTTRGPSRCVA